MTFSIADEQTIANSGIDWAVVGSYTALVLLVVFAAIVAWVVVGFLFKDKTKKALVDTHEPN